MAQSLPESFSAPPRPRRPRAGGWFFALFWGGLTLGAVGIGIGALGWLTRIPPDPNCEEIARFSSDSDRLFCAELQAQSAYPEDVLQAVTWIAPWEGSHPLHAEAAPVLASAIDRLITLAQEVAAQGELERAVTLLQGVPLGHSRRPKAQDQIWTWQQEWAWGQEQVQRFQGAIAQRDWVAAQAQIEAMAALTSDYWRLTRSADLRTLMAQEQEAWAQLEAARALATGGNPEQLEGAIALAQGVPPQTQAWGETKGELDQWSQQLLVYGFQRWEMGDLTGAMAMVQRVPTDLTLAPEAKDLLQFSHAHRLAQQAQADRPTYGQLLALVEAIRGVEAITPTSPFYDAAQGASRDWRQQLADLQTLQLARGIAHLGQDWALTAAAQLAGTIAPDRPRRLQAQTLLAHWTYEQERLHDRPFLVRAERLAQGGTLGDLQRAIAEAQAIALGRALRIEAQTRIADWLRSIQVLEDQPILQTAQTLAAAGNLREAVTTLGAIAPDRPLYSQAQTLAQTWTRTLQTQEDTPLLTRARALASQGAFSAALEVAAQIAPGRALYNEARRDMAIWRAERDYILSLEAPPPEGEPSLPEVTAPEPRRPRSVP